MYSSKRDLDDNQIGALPPEVFTYNTELTDLWVINLNLCDCIDYPYIRLIY